MILRNYSVEQNCFKCDHEVYFTVYFYRLLKPMTDSKATLNFRDRIVGYLCFGGQSQLYRLLIGQFLCWLKISFSAICFVMCKGNL